MNHVKRNIVKKFSLLVCLISIVMPIFAQVKILPQPYLLQPTGKYGIGYQEISLVNLMLCPDGFYQNGLTDEDYSSGNNKYCHEIMLQVYYPTLNGPQLGDLYYAPVIDDFINDLSKHSVITNHQTKQLSALYQIKTYTQRSAIPLNKKSFPVIFFIPGAGVQSQNYINLISELVSHGYILLAMNSVHIAGSVTLSNDHVVQGYYPYQDNVRLEEFSDLHYVMQNLSHIHFDSRLNKIMNFKNMGVLGHSMGAMNLIYYLQQNKHLTSINAAVFLDPGNVLGQKNYPITIQNYPTMVLWSSYFRTHMNGTVNLKDHDQEIILTPDQSDINFSNHINFTDYSTIQYHPLLADKSIQAYLTDADHVNLGKGDGYFIASTLNQYVLAYFDQYLAQ
jgi:hypothetical protein